MEGFSVRKHPLYTTHSNIIRRCRNPKAASYKYYGARGIDVCESWMSFAQFVADMGPRPSDKHTIERKDNSLGYSPDNCVWATRTEQSLNRRKFSGSKNPVVGARQQKNGLLMAKIDLSGKRYVLGYFDDHELVSEVRFDFLQLVKLGPGYATKFLGIERTRSNSSTGHAGVTRLGDAYIARCTIAKERIYIGHFKTIEEALNARLAFIASRA